MRYAIFGIAVIAILLVAGWFWFLSSQPDDTIHEAVHRGDVDAVRKMLKVDPGLINKPNIVGLPEHIMSLSFFILY